MIVDDTELNRILKTTKFDKLESVDSPLKQPDVLSQELLGVISTPANDTACTSGLAPRKASNEELCTAVDPYQGSSLSFSNVVYIMYILCRYTL